jgi:hypothetical protein
MEGLDKQGAHATAKRDNDPDLVTEVEVTFTPVEGGATRVDLEHRNLERFGDKIETVRAAIDSEGGWSGILKLYGESAERGM